MSPEISSFWRDPMYGLIGHSDAIADLALAPLVQRLRHVRLSNIDSIDLPSIANLSRFEHVMGVSYLAQQAPIRNRMQELDRLAFDAAALLHDWAITAFGHLVEEALQYVGANFDHESRLAEIASGSIDSDVGGLEDRQVLHGRGVGLLQWADRVTRNKRESERLIELIAEFIRGKGSAGRLVSGNIDVDNIDNVFRMAYHLGLPIDRDCPLRLAMAINEVNCQTGEPIFEATAVQDIESWVEVRRQVYDLLMLAERDFAGKTMLIYATTLAFAASAIRESDWSLTDDVFYAKLINSGSIGAREAAERWACGEQWDMAPLVWMEGDRPAYSQLMSFSRELSEKLGREFFAYGIRDKRERVISFQISGSGSMTRGASSRQWLFGFGSPLRKAIGVKECDQGWSLAERRFGSRVLVKASRGSASAMESQWLI